jgi:hypothetical protein
MKLNDIEESLASARIVEEQTLDNPELEIPVDPELADYMGAVYDPALEDEMDAALPDRLIFSGGSLS